MNQITGRTTVALRKTLAVLLFCCGMIIFNFSIQAAPGESKTLGTVSVLDQGINEFLSGRKMLYNAEGSLSKITTALNNCRGILNKLPEGYDKYYWLAQVEYLAGEAAQFAGKEDKKQAALRFTTSGDLAVKALKFNPKSSDANRICADTIMKLMRYNGPIYIASKAPRIASILDKAVELDNNNYKAVISYGIYYLNAPAIAGGSVEKGMENLQKGLQSKDEFDRYTALVWLGKVYQKMKNNNASEKRFLRAKKIYSHSEGFIKFIKNNY